MYNALHHSCHHKNLFLSATNKIVIQDNVLLGWNVEIRDNDGHKILYDKESSFVQNSTKKVIIREKVWISSNVLIMGNTDIGANSVVGVRSMTNKVYPSHSLIAGSPGRIIRKIYDWEI